MINLKDINEINYDQCVLLKVRSNQEDYIYSNLVSLRKYEEDKQNVVTLAVYHNEVIVGFVMFRVVKDFDCYFIWSLMIDEKYQGLGYGYKALKKLIHWLKNDGRCTRATTTVVEGNEGVLNLYYKVGFSDINEMIDGEIDLELKFV